MISSLASQWSGSGSPHTAHASSSAAFLHIFATSADRGSFLMSSAARGFLGFCALAACFPFFAAASLPAALAGESRASDPSGDPLRFFCPSLRAFMTDAGTECRGTGLASPRLTAAET